MKKIVEDDEMAKLLVYQTPDCLSKPVPSEEERYGLINKQVTGHRFTKEIVSESKSWISLSMSNFVPEESFRHFSDSYLMGNIYFYILVDSGIMDTETGYRQDLILARLYDLFDESVDLGIGRLKLSTMIENWEHGNKLGGYTLGFKTVDFK